MAQYELTVMRVHVRSHCKFAAVILRFMPVEFVNFECAAEPAKKKQKASDGG